MAVSAVGAVIVPFGACLGMKEARAERDTRGRKASSENSIIGIGTAASRAMG